MSSTEADFSQVIFAAIEAGGTTWAAALSYADSIESPFDVISVPTNVDPRVTISAVRRWLRSQHKKYGISAVGIGSFGPIDPNVKSNTYGFITSTPKPGWRNTDVVGLLGFIARKSGDDTKVASEEFDCECDGEFSSLPFMFDTDVNAPALAEFLHYQQNVNSQLTSSAYVTVGTGVGAGLVVNGETVRGLVHPEGGHIPVMRFPGDEYEGCCPYHKCCLEGMVCSRALAERANLWCSDVRACGQRECDVSKLASLPDDHPVWDSAAYYLAQLAMNLVLLTSMERISFGGGIFNRTILFEKIRGHLKTLLNGYIQNDAVTTEVGLEKYVSESVWGANSGLIGTLFLASEAFRASRLK